MWGVSILFVVHQNFSYSINCVFFSPARRGNLSLSRPSTVSFCSRLLHSTSAVHILLITATFSHNGIMVEVHLLLCWVVEEQYFIFSHYERVLAVWICIKSWLNWKGIDANLMCVHVLWRDEQMWCQFTRLFCWMLLKVPWKIALWGFASLVQQLFGFGGLCCQFPLVNSWPLNRSVHLSCNIPSQMKSSSLSSVWSPTAQL